MPRSLYARALLILLLPVLTLQLVISVGFIQRHFDGVTRQMTSSIATELRFVADLIATDGAQAGRAVATPLGLDVTVPAPALPQDTGRDWTDLSGLSVIAQLQADLPRFEAIELVGNDRVHVWLAVPARAVQISFDRDLVSASNPHQLLVLMLISGALLTVIASIFLRNQLRPIKRMAAAAEAYGKGRMVPFSPTGATEVRAAGMAFLDMRGRIERQTQQRTMMLSGVSHDLRTPLTRMRLGLSMMDDAEAEPLMRDVDEMQQLIDGFLDFARGDASDALEPVDIVDLVADVVGVEQRGGRAVRLHEVTGQENLTGDIPLRGVAVRRALGNLIGNALRYGSCAEVSLTIMERSIRITVEDDGPGIPAGLRDEAMRPFSRLDPARNQNKGSGVGLGLAIVADIARAHGGTLRLGDSAGWGGLQADLVLAR